jgi:hypothetical protein
VALADILAVLSETTLQTRLFAMLICTVMAQKPKDKERGLAEFLFIKSGLSLTEISHRLDIPMKTLSGKNGWSNGRSGELSWEERRRIQISTPHNIEETLLIEMEKIAKGEKSNIDGDQLVKIANSLDKIKKKISVQIVVSVLMQLESFTAADNPDEAVRSLPIHKKFIQHVMQTES